MPDAPRREIREVTVDELRRLYSIGRFEERAKNGELTTRVRPGNEHPAPPRAGEPPGTVSHILQYFDGDELGAMVHEYVRPDGSIGASGRRDPKWLRVREFVYKQARDA